ncbi:hypothetical protein Tco_0504972 [Tanacetum coccineum]
MHFSTCFQFSIHHASCGTVGEVYYLYSPSFEQVLFQRGHHLTEAVVALNLTEVGKEVQAKHHTPQGMVKECEQIIHKEEIWKEGVYHGMEYMETEEAVDKGRQSGETEEVKLTDDTEVVEDKDRGKYRHNQLNKKTFEEIQALYIKEQERDADFVPIGSERDEKMIDKMNKKAAGMDEEEVPEEPESTKVEVKQEGREENIRKRSGRRLKMKATKKSKRQKTDSDLDEEEQLRASLKIVPDEEEEIDLMIWARGILLLNWEFGHFISYSIDKGVPHDYYKCLEIFRSDGSSRWIKTFSEMVTMFDRLDLEELYNLVMQRFESTTLEGVNLVLWGDLKTMFNENAEDDIWKNQEEWILRSWNFYENCGVHTLILEDGTEIHMLAERKYPLTKETLERMLSLKLIAESASESAYNLLRFIQKQIDEYGSHDGTLAIPEQTATGKEISNPFMAGSLSKTTKPTYLVQMC